MSRKMQPVDPGEREKIGKLKNELKSDTGGKVEWLYSGDKVDKDAYLLGKPIDKLILENDSKPSSLISSTVDIANKIRDDPLFEIKKREIEAKKRLLENPLRMKQLQQMYASNRNQQQQQSNSDDSDEERKSKHRRRRDSSDAEDEKSKKKKHKKHHHKEKHKKKDRSRSRSKSPKSRSHSPPVAKNREGYGLTKKSSDKSSHETNPSGGVAHKSEKAREIEEYKHKINKLKEMRSSSSSGGVASSSSHRKSMTDEERQRRLEEMQANAKWRDNVKEKNMKKFEADEKRERKLDEVSRSSRMQTEASNMFNNIMKDAYKSTEDRIKSNMYNIQRNKSSYDSNFVARK